MASVEITSEAGIPSVTLEDLEEFHKSHFGSSTKAVFSVKATPIENTEEIAQEDDLGYYPDGARRTLTDEQVAMFRHSEIYSIQRKRQLQKENLEAENEFNYSQAGLGEPQSTRPDQSEDPTFDLPEQNLDNFMKHYVPGGKNRCDFHAAEEDTSANVMDFAGPDQINRGNITGTRKRRKPDHDEKRPDYHNTTSRRQARELDDAVADVGCLDYGEESTVVQSIETKIERIKVDYADHDETTDPVIKQEIDPPKEGRKIWWPTIG
ncbi:MAG: hypothetical protein Q9168_007021 [Polycauliona sp. 1 TL-2023]